MVPWDYFLLYCDGEWGEIAFAEWGVGGVQHWDGNNWVEIPSSTEYHSYSPQLCYYKQQMMPYNPSQDVLKSLKVSFCEDIPELVNKQEKSSQSSSSGSSSGSGLYSSLSCDGRYVLILESVIVGGGQDADSLVRQSLANYSGASVARPGTCGSLRAVDPSSGGSIYPIYVNYGFDLDGECQAWANGGSVGNVRKMSSSMSKTNECV